MKRIAFAALLLITLNQAHTAEVDQFTTRHIELKNSKDIVNIEANRHVQESLKQLQSSGCDEELLYTELKKGFANHKNGKLTIHMLHDKEFPRHQIALGESVYADWNRLDGYLLGRPAAAASPLAL